MLDAGPPMTADSHHDTEALLAQAGWIRALAGALVRDPELAEDLAQETLTVAIERRPAELRSLRGWLASVLANLVRQVRRTEGRRPARESDGLDSPDRAVSEERSSERLAISRIVVQAVTELDEPYRTTVMLRYFDELPPRRIARLQGVPIKTVNTRLTRAHQKLCEHMREKLGDDHRSWVFALLVLIESRRTARPPIGALRAVVGVCVIAALGLVGSWLADRANPGAPRAPAFDVGVSPTLALDPTFQVGRSGGSRVPLGVSNTQEPSSREPDEPSRASQLRVTATDSTGTPLFAIPLLFVPGQGGTDGEGRSIFEPSGAEPVALGETELDGGLRFDVPGLHGIVEAASPYATLFSAWLTDAPESLPDMALRVVVAPERTLAGRVLDAGGAALENAGVTLRVPALFFFEFPRPLDFARSIEPHVFTDADGGFQFEGVVDLEGSRLIAERAGFEDAALRVAAGAHSDLQVVFAPVVLPGHAITGTLTAADGTPLTRGIVFQGLDTASVDQHGRFTFISSAPTRVLDLAAIAPGFQPLVMEVTGDAVGDSYRYPFAVHFRLEDPALVIDGSVVDASGVPVPDAILFSWDLTPVAVLEELPVTAEAWMSGGHNLDGFTERADALGGFRFDGLLAKTYSIVALDPRTLQIHAHLQVSSGTRGIHIEMPQVPASHVQGRVLDTQGVPIARARVIAYRTVTEVARPWMGDTLVQRERGPSAETDLDGWFDLAVVDATGIALDVRYGAFADSTFPIDSPRVDDVLELVLWRRAYVQVELADASEADGVIFLDETGAPVTVRAFYDTGFEGTRGSAAIQPLAGGRSPMIVVPEVARIAVLVRDVSEVRRVELELKRDGVVVLR